MPEKCKWPKCREDHDQCAVMLSCLAQLPDEPFPGAPDSWYVSNGYSWRFGLDAPTDKERIRLRKESVVEQVTDRLLAWLQNEETTSQWLVRMFGLSPGQALSTCEDRGWAAHARFPHALDGTDVAKLRPATKFPPNAACEILGGVVDWPAVAIVAEYLTINGKWSWVHEFSTRPGSP